MPLKVTSAFCAGWVTFPSTFFTSSSTALCEYDTRAGSSDSCGSSPVIPRIVREMTLPSRLLSSASCTIRSAATRRWASAAVSRNRCCSYFTTSGFWSGRVSCSWIVARASAARMPPTWTPPTVTPSAIRSSREASYAYTPIDPAISRNTKTARKMNDFCRKAYRV